MILLSPYLSTVFIVDMILLILGSVALFWSLKIALFFDRDNTSSSQYKLATKGYLVATIIMFILSIKLLIFLYFIWTMDSLSSLVPGAMCAAGIVSATEYGSAMFGLKIVNLFLLCSWILIHLNDMKSIESQFLKLKFTLFQPLFFLLVLEFILELAHFSRISTDTPVACCSVIFSQSSIQTRAFYHTHSFILGLFFGSFILYLVSSFLKKAIFFGILSISFGMSCIYAIIRFFSPYIYELPTHMCPYCLLQKEYYYIGYFIYILLFLGVLFGVNTLVLHVIKLKVPKKFYSLGVLANSVLLILLCAYPLFYYIRNGVWL